MDDTHNDSTRLQTGLINPPGMLSKLPISIPKHVIHDTFDRDVVIVNLKSGSYYSLTGLAADLWLQTYNGGDKQDLLKAVTSAASEEHLNLFLALLASEGLFEMPECGHPIDADAICNMLHATPFEEKLEKHTDVEQLLLIDPIHEVDSAGWPNRA